MVWKITPTTLGDPLNVAIFITHLRNCLMGATLVSCVCQFLILCPGSGVTFDSLDFGLLPSFLLCP